MSGQSIRLGIESVLVGFNDITRLLCIQCLEINGWKARFKLYCSDKLSLKWRQCLERQGLFKQTNFLQYWRIKNFSFLTSPTSLPSPMTLLHCSSREHYQCLLTRCNNRSIWTDEWPSGSSHPSPLSLGPAPVEGWWVIILKFDCFRQRFFFILSNQQDSKCSTTISLPTECCKVQAGRKPVTRIMKWIKRSSEDKVQMPEI